MAGEIDGPVGRILENRSDVFEFLGEAVEAIDVGLQVVLDLVDFLAIGIHPDGAGATLVTLTHHFQPFVPAQHILM